MLKNMFLLVHFANATIFAHHNVAEELCNQNAIDILPTQLYYHW